jgi:L-aminopeptidase/D-esterase-like protein
MLPETAINNTFYGAIESTEEAIVNALLAAETMTGNSCTVHRLDPDLLAEVWRVHH